MLLGILVVIAVIWDAVWRVIAMWKSAQKGQKAWYISFVIFSTIGILPIIYLLLEKNKEKRSSGSVRFLKAKTRKKARKGKKAVKCPPVKAKKASKTKTTTTTTTQ